MYLKKIATTHVIMCVFFFLLVYSPSLATINVRNTKQIETKQHHTDTHTTPAAFHESV